jgi:hypothetical protein
VLDNTKPVELTPEEQQAIQEYAMRRITGDLARRVPSNDKIDNVIYWRCEAMRPAPEGVKLDCLSQYWQALEAWRIA